MSGTGGSGGGVYETPADNCELLIIQTQLSSPKEEVVDTIQIKDVLDVALQTIGNTTVVVALHRGKLAGGLASPRVQQLRECMVKGIHYQATVTEKSDGQIRVRVEAIHGE